jgi:putative acetyltransferase
MLRIRKATIDDADTIWKAEVATAEMPGQLLSRPDELELASFEAKILALFDTGSYVVAVEGDRICGHAVLEPMPLASRQHVFSLTVELLVRATNARALRLYERLGFGVEGRFRERVRLPNGEFIDDIAMAWFPD